MGLLQFVIPSKMSWYIVVHCTVREVNEIVPRSIIIRFSLIVKIRMMGSIKGLIFGKRICVLVEDGAQHIGDAL